MSSSSTSTGRPPLTGAVFDMDGTISVPNLDFKEMYERCGVPMSEDLLRSIAAMPADQAAAANAVIDEMEAEGRRTLQLEKGAKELASWLAFHGVPMALVTRNSALTVDHMHAALWEPAGLPKFSPAISRDDEGIPPKPDPGAMAAIAEQWGIPVGEGIVMIGDSPSNDVAFGKAAGVSTALVDSGRRYVESASGKEGGGGGSDGGADVVVESLEELPRFLWRTFAIPGPYGSEVGPLVKFPAPPPPSTPAAIAAAAGDATALAKALECWGPSAATGAPHGGGGDDDEDGKEHALDDPLRPNPPLVWAAEAGSEECVKLLLDAAAEATGEGGGCGPEDAVVNARGYVGCTALLRAARRGHVAALKMLLAAGANPNVPNVKRQYPLHFAAFKLKPDAVDVLLEGGASTIVLDRKGRTPAEDTSSEAIRGAILAARRASL
jgi:phosphoglycolate phosphatase-like HAD superfamily hydrolase